MINKKITTVEEYLRALTPSQRIVANTLRQIIKHAAPEAEEVISYQMPAYKYQGILVYFGIYAHHVGLYPTGSGVEAFKEELSSYVTSKGTVQLPIDEPLPEKLITEIVKFRLQENKKK